MLCSRSRLPERDYWSRASEGIPLDIFGAQPQPTSTLEERSHYVAATAVFMVSGTPLIWFGLIL